MPHESGAHLALGVGRESELGRLEVVAQYVFTPLPDRV